MYYNELKNNALESRDDLVRALGSLVAPLNILVSRGDSKLYPGDTGAHYTKTGAGMEGFLRPLWGLVPYLMGNNPPEGEMAAFLETSSAGLAEGVNPDSEGYWGDPGDIDQRFVEMAVIGLALCMTPDLFWGRMKDTDRQNLKQWLRVVNTHEYPLCNWLFFRVLVNRGLQSVSGEGSLQQIERDLDTLDTYYQGDGWYSDGNTEQYDYYISFAMHFYGMIYSRLAEKDDPLRSARYKKRAAVFAGDFLNWFSPGGEALPFGRSMTYRFAQGAFWSAAAFCGLENEPGCSWLTPGVQKGLLLRHLRSWFRKPVFTESGLLTIGYGYPNLNMAENYNSPGSPYWALKSFLVLALPETSAFWEAREMPFPGEAPPRGLQKHPRFLYSRNPADGNLLVLSGGQFAVFDPRHNENKYSKFAYSTLFGFSVPTGTRKLEQMGADNTLLVSRDGEYWQPRGRTSGHDFDHDALVSDWSAGPDILIRTIQFVMGHDQIRIHLVRTGKEIQICDGGHACPVDDDYQIHSCATGSRAADYTGKKLFSCIESLDISDEKGGAFRSAAGSGFLIGAAPNSSMLYPRTTIPSLRITLAPGHWMMGSRVSGGALSSESTSPDHASPGGEPMEIIQKSSCCEIRLGDDCLTIPGEWLCLQNC